MQGRWCHAHDASREVPDDSAHFVTWRNRQRTQTISSARKSLTFVNVGPGATRSPSGLKKL